MAEPGVIIEGLLPELDALYIKEVLKKQFVTVVEIISPRNKPEISLMQEYQKRCEKLLRQEVNVIEIDVNVQSKDWFRMHLLKPILTILQFIFLISCHALLELIGDSHLNALLFH